MKPFSLILSDSEFLAQVELDRIRAHWEAKGYAVEEVSADDPQAVLYALDTPSLFGDGRFVIVRGSAQRLGDATDRLAGWAASPPKGIAAVFVFERAPKLRKALGSHADVVEPAPPKPWETADWVGKFAKGRGRTISKEAAAALVEALGTDLRELATAVEQLATATSGAIGVEVVSRLFRGLESALYQFLDAVLQRDRASALRHLGALMRSGQHPLAIHAALANQFRGLAAARDAGRMPAAALAKEAGLTVGYVNRAYRHGRNFDAGEIRRAFRSLADADLALKGGERSEGQPEGLVLEQVVAEICGEPGARAAAGGSRRSR